MQRWTAGQMSEAQYRAACELHHRTFPKPGRTLEDVLRRKRDVWMGEDVCPGPNVSRVPPWRWVLVDEAGRAWANAAGLIRRVRTAAGTMDVLGLKDVASDPAARGQGLGEQVVRKVWEEVTRGALPVCLFETGDARPFYEKLGARVVDNVFIDSTDPTGSRENPFKDDWAMVWPGEAEWPSGEVDLLGPGY